MNATAALKFVYWFHQSRIWLAAITHNKLADVNLVAGPAYSLIALYLAALDQAWLRQSRPVRVTIAPAIKVENARMMSAVLPISSAS